MKQLTVLLVFLFAIALVIGAHFALDYLANTNPDSPPAGEISESVDAPPESERSGKWTTVRKHFVGDHPECEACGSVDNLNVHHVKPFNVHPELELSVDNLITLCRDCHFRIGHDPDGPDGPLGPNWKLSNPNVRRDARLYADSLELAP